MEIILLEDIDKVGEKHEIVDVKPGYGRNYLIPQGLAIIANETNRSKLDEIKQKATDVLEKRKAEVQAVADKLADKVLKIGAKAGTSGKIFGSVTNLQIANALSEQLEIEIDRRKVILPEEIKTIGDYEASLDLHPDVEVKVKFEVIAE